VRWQRNPLPLLTQLIAARGVAGNTIAAMRSLHRDDMVDAAPSSTWMVEGSLASISDQFSAFTHGSATVRFIELMFNERDQDVPPAVQEEFGKNAAWEHWRKSAAFITNYLLSRVFELKWYPVDAVGSAGAATGGEGQPKKTVDAVPFGMVPDGVELPQGWAEATGAVVRGSTETVAGQVEVGGYGVDDLKVLLLSPNIALRYCTSSEAEHSKATYVFNCLNTKRTAEVMGEAASLHVDGECMRVKASGAASPATSAPSKEEMEYKDGTSRWVNILSSCRT